MREQIAQYNELKTKTTKQLDKAYRKLDGAKLEKTINEIHLEASKETHKLIQELLSCENVKEEIRDVLESLQDVIQGDLEFVFEDSEFYFEEIETLTK
jgi:hypothetical protein